MKNFKALALTLLAATTLGFAAPKAEAGNFTPIHFNGEYVGQYNCNEDTFNGLTYNEVMQKARKDGAPAIFVNALFTAGTNQCNN